MSGGLSNFFSTSFPNPVPGTKSGGVFSGEEEEEEEEEGGGAGEGRWRWIDSHSGKKGVTKTRYNNHPWVGKKNHLNLLF